MIKFNAFFFKHTIHEGSVTDISLIKPCLRVDCPFVSCFKIVNYCYVLAAVNQFVYCM